MNLNACTVADALVVVGGKLGLRPDNDREEVLAYLNRIRSMWYHNFHRVSLFDDWLECVPVLDLCMACTNCHCACYKGFAIPSHLSGVVTAWAGLESMNLRSRWWEKDADRFRGAGLNLIELPGEFATSRDINEEFYVRVLAGPEDHDKTMTVRGVTCSGEIKDLCFKLVGDGWCEVDAIVRGIVSIQMPSRCQKITISARKSDGTVVDIDTHYPTDPSVPSFRRFKVEAGCSACSVYVQANRRFRELTSDSDIVEIGDRLVLEHGASYFKHAESTVEKAEIVRGDRDLAIMNELIRGMLKRERGGNTRDGALMIRGRRTRKATLPGYSGRR